MSRLLNYFLREINDFHKEAEAENHILNFVYLQLNNNCNIESTKCIMDCEAARSGEQMQTNTYIKIIDQLKKQYKKRIAIVLSGGEPLLFPEMEIIANRLKENKLRWGLITDGTLLTKEKAKFFEQNNISSYSFYLQNLQKKYDDCNGNGTFAKIITGIENAVQTKVKYHEIITSVNKSNINDLEEIGKIVKDTGIQTWRIDILPEKELKIDENQYRQLLDFISEEREKTRYDEINVIFGKYAWLPYEAEKKLRMNHFICRSGINDIAIRSNGQITGSLLSDSGFDVGNIKNENYDIKKIWEKKFSHFRKRDWIYQTNCGNCKNVRHCKGSSIEYWSPESKEPAFCYEKR